MGNRKNTMDMMITLRGTNEVCHNIRNLLTNRRAYFYIATHPRVPKISGQVSGGVPKGCHMRYKRKNFRRWSYDAGEGP